MSGEEVGEEGEEFCLTEGEGDVVCPGDQRRVEPGATQSGVEEGGGGSLEREESGEREGENRFVR